MGTSLSCLCPALFGSERVAIGLGLEAEYPKGTTS